MSYKRKAGSKVAVPRHRGRRGYFWGDPGKGYPGTNISRASMDAQCRTIERRTRRQGRAECEAGFREYEEGCGV